MSDKPKKSAVVVLTIDDKVMTIVVPHVVAIEDKVLANAQTILDIYLTGGKVVTVQTDSQQASDINQTLHKALWEFYA